MWKESKGGRARGTKERQKIQREEGGERRPPMTDLPVN